MISVAIYDKNRKIIKKEESLSAVHMLVDRVYEAGDIIKLTLEKKCFYDMSLDVGMKNSIVYAKEETLEYTIPFGETRTPYPPGAFEGRYHILEVKQIDKTNSEDTWDLSTNSHDVRGNTSIYPHCTASVETRDESIFAARNTIDGFIETDGHGIWPFTSWGDNEDPHAEIQIWFGRTVEITEVIINIRSDFPHDNYWHHATLCFSNGSSMDIDLKKTGEGQIFKIEDVQCEWVKLCNFVKDEKDPSPFPALTYWRVNGREKA